MLQHVYILMIAIQMTYMELKV